MKITVFISGRGSTLNALLEKDSNSYQIVQVISNKPEALGLHYAQTHNIPTFILNIDDFHTSKALNILNTYNPDLIILSGFMRILPASFLKNYANRIINIHPSLLPKYKGLHTHQRVIEAKEKYHGASIHFVIPALDEGPLIAQVRIKIPENSNPSALADYLLPFEHLLMTQVVEQIASGDIQLPKGETLSHEKALYFKGIYTEGTPKLILQKT